MIGQGTELFETTCEEFYRQGYTEVPTLEIFHTNGQAESATCPCQSDVDRKSAASTPPASPHVESLEDQLAARRPEQLVALLMELTGCDLSLFV